MKTQKAKGIFVGLNNVLDVSNLAVVSTRYYKNGYFLIDSKKAAKEFAKNYKHIYGYACSFDFFARPCPLNPSHGFVESRPISSEKEMLDIFDEVRRADPKGELILAPKFNKVDYNAIYVDDGLISIGPGNDGATSGKNSISFPVAPSKYRTKFKKAAGIKSESVYMEAIKPAKSKIEPNLWHIVQLRGGPKMETSGVDYIPENSKVTSVVKPHDDLLKWAEEVSNFSPGTVVYGNGHTLASHAAVHCLLHNIPFITSFKPKVGDTIKKTEEKKYNIKKEDFRRGVLWALNVNLNKFNTLELFYFAFSSLHNWNFIRKSEHAGYILGAAMGTLSCLASALVLGEYRHCNETHRHTKLNISSSKFSGKSRNCVYKDVLSDNSYSVLKNLPDSLYSFNYGDWSSGYGSKPWAVCATETIGLYTDLVRVYNSRTKNLSEKEYKKLISRFNMLINLVHNNGWWFNKISELSDMENCSSRPAMSALACANVYYSAIKGAKAIPEATDKIDHFKGKKETAILKKKNKYFYTEVNYVYSLGNGTDLYRINLKDAQSKSMIASKELQLNIEDSMKISKSRIKKILYKRYLPVRSGKFFFSKDYQFSLEDFSF